VRVRAWRVPTQNTERVIISVSRFRYRYLHVVCVCVHCWHYNT